jgi:2-oxoglutarate dehydrogenase E2 component (dihydrolipoamide succinyltransferase)
MPQLGETVTEGTIIRWLKKVGDPVAHDEPLFEVSTDKVDSEVPSSAAGVLSEILVAEGATVDVGTKLAVVSEAAGAPPAAPAAPTAAAPTAPAPTAPAAPTASEAAEAAAAAVLAEASAAARSAAPPAAPDLAAAAAVLAGAPAVQEPETAQQGEAEEGTDSEGTETNGKGLVLSPVVRQLVAEYGIDPGSIPGTGKGGRVTRADVLGFIDRRAAGGAASPATADASRVATAAPVAAAPVAPALAPAAPAPVAGPAAAPGAAASYAPVRGPRDEVVPFTNIRRLTAEHMVRSKATSAHTLTVIEADFERIERVRSAHKNRFREEEGIGLSYLPFIARAVVETLRVFPQLNASVVDDALVIHHDVHLGIAVNLDQRGLIVPVVRDADGQSLRGLARAMAELADRARTRKLSADDVVGGTFTITNPGPFGTFLTAPIINQPQVAILSTDGVKRRPVVITAPDGSEAIGIHSVGMLALSFDHRAVDGAYASGFLHALSQALETRDWEAEL